MARILQVCNSEFYLTKFLRPLIGALSARGHIVECACGGIESGKQPLGPDVVVHPFAFPQEKSPLQFARSIRRMRHLLRTGAYDCVDGHNRNSSMVARVAAWAERVPVNIYTAHGFYFHDDQSTMRREATILLEAALARITGFTLSQSQQDLDLMVRRKLIRADRIRYIGNGIDTQRFKPGLDRPAIERKLGLRPGRFRISGVGRLVEGKGFIDALDAFTRVHAGHPETELVIVGGNIEQDLNACADELGRAIVARGLQESVILTGLTDEVAGYLGCSDVFVLPSYREGLPRALLEAMSTGLPVVATTIRGSVEAVVDGETGYLYAPHDVARLTELLGQMLESPALRLSMGAKGRARVVEHFEERGYIQRQVEAIEQLLDAWRRSDV